MNENLNLIKILKDIPIGTKLYCTIIGEVEFNGITSDKKINIKYDEIYDLNLQSNGHLYSTKPFINSECILFPSKSQRDWSKFKFIETFKENEPIMCYNDIDGWVLRPATGVGNSVYGRKRDYSFIERIRVSEFDFENYCKKK